MTPLEALASLTRYGDVLLHQEVLKSPPDTTLFRVSVLPKSPKVLPFHEQRVVLHLELSQANFDVEMLTWERLLVQAAIPTEKRKA